MKRRYILFGELILITILSLFIVNAATTLNSPKDNYNYTQTLNFSCTTALLDAINASLLYNKSGGAATTYLITITNTTAEQTTFEDSSVSITSLTDAATYNFTCKVDNGTDVEYATAVDEITIDNNAPTITTSVDKKFVEFMSNVKVICSCSDTIDSSPTTTRTLHKGTTGNTVSVSASPYTLSGGDLNKIGENIWECKCSDYTGNADSTNVTFTIESSEEPEIITPQQQTAANTNLFILFIIAAIVIIVIIIITLVSLK